MSVQVFVSSISGNREMKEQQQRIQMVLSSKKIAFKEVDISQDTAHKDLMRRIAGDPKALPPQICNGAVYCGDFAAFESAIEAENLEAFLKL
uniref:SH3 domain-binding glutamic acid-rich-like protein n=1 Tax=Neogobius melanostomus TaxID=47308 RepID=A0A8C6U7S1_9GOBI